MPYYDEVSGHDVVPIVATTRFSNGATSVARGNAFNTYVKCRSYRSGAPKGNISNRTVLDITADPYAYFINGARDRKFEEALRLRGFEITNMPPDRGHPFSLETVRILYRGSGSSPWGEGSVTTNSVVPAVNFLDFPVPTSSVATYAYQTWGKMAPTSVVFDMAQFIGELREGLPSIVPSLLKGKVSFFKDLGSDYLNIEFGWKPFINDLQNAAKALLSAQQAISGPYGPVHRYHKVDDPQNVTVTTPSDTYGAPLTFIPNGWADAEIMRAIRHPNVSSTDIAVGWNQTKTTTVDRKSWFEANFFLLPKIGYDPNNFLSRLDSLVNTRITPATLWELAPWSWLVDWGLRIGQALQTAERLADDRVHAQYAYGMSTTTKTVAIQSGSRPYLSSAMRYTRKERVRANPYGFMVGGMTGLTTWQQSIILALGLTKTGR